MIKFETTKGDSAAGERIGLLEILKTVSHSYSARSNRQILR